MSRGGAVVASLLVTIGRPAWWFLALAGFLVRGGFVLFLLPIVLLPSPLAISNIAAPLIVPIVLGRVGSDLLILAVVALAAVVTWLVVGGWIGAATEVALIREGAAEAAEEGVDRASAGRPATLDQWPPVMPRDRALIVRIVIARLLAWLPLAGAIGIGTVRVVALTYMELTRPVDVETPLVFRVALGAAPELALVALAWLGGELIGGLAARRIVLEGSSPARALVAAVGDLIHRPIATLVPWLVTTGLLVAILGATIGAAGIAWSRVMVALSARSVDPPIAALNLLLFVAIWFAALDLGGLFAAVRGSVQTFEYLRQRSSTGTFGASAHHRPGDWSVPDEGGSL